MYLQKDEEREKDPHNFPKPMAESNVPAKMQSLNEALEQTYELAEAENYRRKIIIGPIDAFPRDDLLATNRPLALLLETLFTRVERKSSNSDVQ